MSVMFDRISETIDNTLTEFPSVSFQISSFYIHYKERLVCYNRTDNESRYSRGFSIEYKLSQITEEPIRVLDATCQQMNLLEVFLLSAPINAQYSLVSVYSKVISYPDLSFHRQAGAAFGFK